MLLDKGASADAADPEGSTPLHLAIKKGRAEMVRFLLQKGVDPKAKDGKDRTPFDLASEYSYRDIVSILKDTGAGRSRARKQLMSPRSWPGPSRSEKRSFGLWDTADSR